MLEEQIKQFEEWVQSTKTLPAEIYKRLTELLDGAEAKRNNELEGESDENLQSTKH